MDVDSKSEDLKKYKHLGMELTDKILDALVRDPDVNSKIHTYACIDALNSVLCNFMSAMVKYGAHDMVDILDMLDNAKAAILHECTLEDNKK